MPTSQSTQTEPCVPRHSTPSPPPADPLYGVFEDTVATIEMLVFSFPIDPEISTTLLNTSSQDFLEGILDQLIEWGVDVYGRSGSLRVIATTLVADVIHEILENLQDELDKIQLQAVQWQKKSGMIYVIGRSRRQYFSQALVNLRGFVPFICDKYAKVQAGAAMTTIDGLALQSDPAELEEGQILESIEGTGGTCESLFVKQSPAA